MGYAIGAAMACACLLAGAARSVADDAVPPAAAVSAPVVTLSADPFISDVNSNTADVSTAFRAQTEGLTAQGIVHLTDWLAFGIAGLHSDSTIKYSLQDQRTTAASNAAGAVVEIGGKPVLWRTVASYAWDRFTTSLPVDQQASWPGYERAVDTALTYRGLIGPILLEPTVGFRLSDFHEKGYTTSGLFGIVEPTQNRSSQQERIGLRISAVGAYIAPGVMVTPWVRGELRYSDSPHPAFSLAPDNTAEMAGSQFTAALPSTEPEHFPDRLEHMLSVGLEVAADRGFRAYVSAMIANSATTQWLSAQAGLGWRF